MLEPSTLLQGGVVAFAGLAARHLIITISCTLTNVATNLLTISDFVNRTTTLIVTGQQCRRHFVQPGWQMCRCAVVPQIILHDYCVL